MVQDETKYWRSNLNQEKTEEGNSYLGHGTISFLKIMISFGEAIWHKVNKIYWVWNQIQI